ILQGVHFLMLRSKVGPMLAAIVLIVTTVSGGFAQKPLDEIIARVGNDIILKSEYDNQLKSLRDELTQRGMQGAQLEQAFKEQAKDVLRDLVDNSLLMQQAKEMGLSGDLEVIKQEERMRQEN